MNKTYTSKWNAALGAWVACSEVSKRGGKQTAVGVVLLCMAAAAQAQNCSQAPDGSYLPGNSGPDATCTVVPPTAGQLSQTGAAGFYILTRSNLDSVLTIGNADIKAHVTGGYGGIGNQYATGPGAPGGRNASMQAGNIKLDIASTENTGSIGSHSGVNVSVANADITAAMTYAGDNRSGGVAIYGVLAGSTVDSGEGGTNNTARNGTFTTVSFDNLALNQTSSGGTKTPVLNSGLRAIQGANQDAGNGSSGKIEVKGQLNMSMTGERMEGIYVSGAATGSGGEAVSQAVLNNSTIKLVRSGAAADSSAIKVGKSRAVGTGKGLVTSTGALQIDMDPTLGGSQPYMSPAIKLAVSGSQLLANGANSSASIKASRSALAIGIDDWGSSTDSQNIQAQFGKATVTTQSVTAPLLLIDSGQQNAQILFDQGSDLSAASNGYLIDIVKYRSSTTASSVQLTLDHASVARGLSNKAYPSSTLNIGLNNASVWSLVEKSNGDKTATYTSLAMTAASRLQGFKAGAGAFVMNGPVSSNASTIDLVDSEPNDVLTVQSSYTGSNAAVLAVDTCLGDSSAPSDVLKVVGDTSGTTVIKVSPSAGAACGGALTTGNGILVVDVSGNSAATFTLDGGTVAQGNFVYELVKVGNNWYLQSRLGTGTIVVRKQVNAPSGAAPFSGAIDFALSCDSGPVQNGSIYVSNNQGVSNPITVPAGSQCTVTETLPAAPAGYAWGPPAYSPISPVVTGQEQAATITNTLSNTVAATGMLQVNKTVQVPEGAAPYNGTISFGVACVNPAFSTAGSIAVAGNQGSAAPIAVPAGSQCTVTETLPADPDGMAWAAPTYSQPASVVAGQTATATITNRLTKQTRDLARVPVNAPLALGGLAGLIGLMAWRRQRAEKQSNR
ncbi:DUF5979 domain-containing protein [Comamonas koreensis]|uniref:DUF5979 domain-containing protein n=1 Tax=Comamonas koreensis TaxID=160825 RepID=A0AAW4XT78_9BURK|nr:DUF5979 domain-containing protein [Comamonas koreensis]MCD2164179.1 DUF5979 domain-containing protein [Comamonas koreensis]